MKVSNNNNKKKRKEKLNNNQLQNAFGRNYLFGSWSIADTDLAIMLNRLIFNNDPVPMLLKRYAAHQWQHPAIQEWLALKRPFEN